LCFSKNFKILNFEEKLFTVVSGLEFEMTLKFFELTLLNLLILEFFIKSKANLLVLVLLKIFDMLEYIFDYY